MMQVPPIPIDEKYRLDALRSLNLLDTAPEPQFDSLVRLGQKLFDVEICLISLVDSNRQWFKACVGLGASETSRDISFCGHAIIGDDPFVIYDAQEDERFRDNPLVTGPPHIRFYAGIPLRIPVGYKLGTLCIISSKPRSDFSAEDKARLTDLASAAMSGIALRALREDGDKLRTAFEQYVTFAQITKSPMAVISSTGTVENCNEAFNVFCGGAKAEGRALESVLNVGPDWMQRAAAAKELIVHSKVEEAPPAMLYCNGEGYLLAG